MSKRLLFLMGFLLVCVGPVTGQAAEESKQAWAPERLLIFEESNGRPEGLTVPIAAEWVWPPDKLSAFFSGHLRRSSERRLHARVQKSWFDTASGTTFVMRQKLVTGIEPEPTDQFRLEMGVITKATDKEVYVQVSPDYLVLPPFSNNSETPYVGAVAVITLQCPHLKSPNGTFTVQQAFAVAVEKDSGQSSEKPIGVDLREALSPALHIPVPDDKAAYTLTVDVCVMRSMAAASFQFLSSVPLYDGDDEEN